ncbi:uncharacterized protein VICG_01183 [Vittaforma corneae ATCC 50505]|uniref:Uncharacterized protein n=1 Tax=Vittaforma corneae (strain ATCC 50505) TaxID=993615 RepID=L2GLV5_VITCO|nr:uncharacterized protein VICG_01183 [Vittaforma corneae ATCC 50505]ELA41831.1 hypothetical protein VICG_01183 [Vittaforma corneae ATCC 50505]
MSNSSSDDLLEFLKKHFKVRMESDGSFTVYTNSGTYLISKADSSSFVNASTSGQSQALAREHRPSEPQTSKEDSLFEPLIKDKPGEEHISPFGKIGADDIAPNFDQKLKKKSKVKGMVASPDNLDSSDDNPFINVDPAYPSKKKKDRGPEPDPDHYDPGKNVFD